MNWGKKLAEYAPDIASAIFSGGATLPSLAIKAIRDATGQDVNSEADVEAIIEGASPEVLLKIKAANNSFKIEMKRLDNELVATELNDTQNARKENKHSPMPAIIWCVLSAIFGSTLYFLFDSSIPEGNENTVYFMLGQLSAGWTGATAYWVGTTRSSAQKTMDSIKGIK